MSYIVWRCMNRGRLGPSAFHVLFSSEKTCEIAAGSDHGVLIELMLSGRKQNGDGDGQSIFHPRVETE